PPRLDAAVGRRYGPPESSDWPEGFNSFTPRSVTRLEPRMPIRQFKTISQAAYDVFADSGFSMAGAVAYAFVLSLFPFCIFLGALAGYFGGEQLAKQAVQQLFQMAPAPVVQAIAPEVMRVMG